MNLFNDKYNAFLTGFGQGRKMVLSTSENNKVSSRMMSVILINGEFYFQTLDNDLFCDIFQKCFKGSFEAYSSLKNERLFCVKPLFVERWIYSNSIPYIEIFDIENEQYSYKKYLGL